MANPTLLSRLLCADADKNTIPDTDAGTAGVFSQQYGWQAINSLPLSAGGKAVQRQDFNGVFNLLGGIAFYAQKGYTWQWDSSQDYFVGCIVIDPNDSKRYECISDVTANATSPSADTTHWTEFKSGLEADQIPAVNKRDVITTSGTYTAPVTGWYKITAKGGGGGGAGGTYINDHACGGGGGGEGGTTIAYVSMTAGETATVVIGAGGNGAIGGNNGSDGGDTSVTYDGNTYIGGGGKGGKYGSPTAEASQAGMGGVGTINGCAGGSATRTDVINAGGSGGGAGGAVALVSTTQTAGTQGGGGAGGFGDGTPRAGSAGGDGYVWFEYFATV